MKELAQSRNRSIELILLVLEADGYALSLTKDVEEMKGYCVCACVCVFHCYSYSVLMAACACVQ